eukprot:GHVT01062628.1.p1 GENE.GHVT01062628.1~~GHVT01062628.1.p1  ORF type:complete len:226 (+),score=26.34 GHVT01062628.1:773-1450(+)
MRTCVLALQEVSDCALSRQGAASAAVATRGFKNNVGLHPRPRCAWKASRSSSSSWGNVDMLALKSASSSRKSDTGGSHRVSESFSEPGAPVPLRSSSSRNSKTHSRSFPSSGDRLKKILCKLSEGGNTFWSFALLEQITRAPLGPHIFFPTPPLEPCAHASPRPTRRGRPHTLELPNRYHGEKHVPGERGPPGGRRVGQHPAAQDVRYLPQTSWHSRRQHNWEAP